MRIGFLSDLHIDFNTEIMEYAIDVISRMKYANKIDKLFLGGDISNDYLVSLEFAEKTDSYLIFGNHEYWSISYNGAKKIKNDKYIHGKVIELNNDYVVIGLDGFWDYSFVTKVNNEYNAAITKDLKELRRNGHRYFDLSRNKIKKHEEVFNEMESVLIKLLEENKDKKVILLTHYVPSSEFILYKEDAIWNMNNAFMGSVRYQEIAEEYKVDKVIFGHTHTKFSKKINGIEYICNPVGYRRYEYSETFEERVNKTIKIIDI